MNIENTANDNDWNNIGITNSVSKPTSFYERAFDFLPSWLGKLFPE